MVKLKQIPLDYGVVATQTAPLMSNPNISKTRVKIAYPGLNRNGSYISKEILERAAQTSLGLTPIVGRYSREEGDFEEHNASFDRHGNMVRDTVPYGVVSENPNHAWEFSIDKDGVEREYLTADAYLWTGRYPETIQIVRDGVNNQSMELDEKTIVSEWAKLPNSNEEAFILKEINFLGLCILGSDIEPCFEGASFEANTDFSKSNQLKYSLQLESDREYKKEMGDFMSTLKFALENDPSIVSVQKVDNEDSLEKVQVTIDELDIAAGTEPDQSSVNAIDNAIDTLLLIEQELDQEDIIVPNTKEASDALAEMAGGTKDIVSDPQFELATAISSPFKEEEEMTLEEQLALQNAEKKEPEVPVAPVAEPKAEPVAEPVAPVEPAAPVAEPAAPVAEPAAPVVERTPIEEKRKALNGAVEDEAPEVGGIEGVSGNLDKLNDILQAIEEAKQIEAQLRQLLPQEENDFAEEGKKEDEDMDTEGAPAPVAPQEGEVKEDPAVPLEEDKEKEKNKNFENLGGLKQDRKEEGAPEATGKTIDEPAKPTDVEKKEMAPTNVEPEEKEMTPSTPEATATPDKKKKDIQTYQLEVEELSKTVSNMSLELARFRDENKALKEFKNGIETANKEKVFEDFSFISDEDKATIRSNFANLSVDEVEAKCAVIAYRMNIFSNKAATGQNTHLNADIVSFSTEAGNTGSSVEDTIASALRSFRK